MAEPNPSNVSPWYLRNINQALALDEASGNVFVRTGFQGNIIISGNVNIPGAVTVVSNEADPLYTHTHIFTSTDQEVSNANPFAVDVISGNITITNTPDVTGNVIVSGNVNANIINSNIEVTQGTDPWIVSGNVNIGTMPEVEIKNDIDNPIPISKNTNVNSITNPLYVEGVNNGSFFAPTQSDAFGRLRVSNPLTFFDTQARYFDHQQFVTANTGTATAIYDSNSSTFALSVTTNGDSIIRETTKSFLYQPGKSLLVLNTFAMNAPTSGLIQRVGYFSAQNGIFFEANGTTLNMVIRSYSSGSMVENRIAQNSWNGDPLDGTGPSGITLNPALTQIFWTDIEWLGVGSVRTGFVINGQFIVCHTFNHANQSGNTTTYMTTGSLPIRYEISSSGTIGTMRQICSSVISEGGYSLTGAPAAIGHTLESPIRLANDPAVFTPLISIRLKSTNSDAIVLPTKYTILPQDQAVVKFRLYIRGITTGGTWNDFGSNSSVQYNLNPTSITSGVVSDEGFLVANNQGVSVPQLESFGFTNQLQRDNLANVMYEYVLTAATTGTNIDVWATIGWQEVT